MPDRSSLARLLQGVVLAIAVAALAWLLAWWPSRPAVAVAGALVIGCIHAVVLAAEFLLLVAIRRNDPTPKASAAQLVRAWWRETLLNFRIFGGRLPFAWRRQPDTLDGTPGLPGIVFVHGFMCNRGFWTPWLREAATRGHPYVAVNLEPVHGSLDGYAPAIDAAAQRVQAATGRPPVLVCHSMGGLAARAWLRRAGVGRVAHVVTIGSPHQGTALARFARRANTRQMRIDGDWLRDLGAADGPLRDRFTCWYGNCDNVVAPPLAATLPGADNRLVPGAAHVDLAFQPEVIEETFALVRAIEVTHEGAVNRPMA